MPLEEAQSGSAHYQSQKFFKVNFKLLKPKSKPKISISRGGGSKSTSKPKISISRGGGVGGQNLKSKPKISVSRGGRVRWEELVTS